MTADLCALVRADHDDLDRELAAMVDPRTPNHALSSHLEALRAALAVHVAAEAVALEAMCVRVAAPSAMAMLVEHVGREHASQQAAVVALGRVEPASGAWYARALDIRVAVLDHGGRAELFRWTLQDHVPLSVRRELAAAYTVERTRRCYGSSRTPGPRVPVGGG